MQLSLKGTEYGNNSLIKMEDIGEGDEALICSTSFRPCCGTPPNRFGEWYYPNGVANDCSIVISYDINFYQSLNKSDSLTYISIFITS